MIDKLFTHEIWQTLGALIARHPTLLLLFLVLLGGIIQQWLDGRALSLVSRVSLILSDRADFGGEKGEGYLSSEPIVAEGGSERRAGEA